MFNSSEAVEDSGGGLRAVVKEKQDTQVNYETTLECQDYCRLVIGILVGEVAHYCENIGGFVGCVNIIATPDLMVLRMCLHGVCSNNIEVVAASFQAFEEVYQALVFRR